jgi:hypothetical protein
MVENVPESVPAGRVLAVVESQGDVKSMPVNATKLSVKSSTFKLVHCARAE